MSKDHDFVVEFIEIYKSLPCLWNKKEFAITTREGSLYNLLLQKFQDYYDKAAKAMMGDLVTPLPAGLLVDSWGRKLCLLLSAPIMILGWLLVLTTRNVVVLYVVRTLQGFAAGIIIVVMPIYVGEISEARHRGTLSASLAIFMYLGVFMEYIIAPLVSYQTLALVSLAIPILFLVTFVFMPESPYFWLIKGNEEKALKSLTWLRGGIYQEHNDFRQAVEDELNAMKVSVEEDLAQKSSSSWHDLVSTPANRRCLLIVQVADTLQMVCGISAVLAYVTTALTPTKGESWLKPEQYTMLFGIAILLSTLVSSATVDRLGRRPILLSSCLGVAICLFFEGMFFYVDSETGIEVSRYNWVAFILITIYGVLLCGGIGALAPTIQSEFFPSHNRGLGNGVIIMVSNCISFIILEMYYYIEVAVGTYFNFWLYGASGLFGFIFVYFYLPESKNKTLEEIQMEMKKLNKGSKNQETNVE